ncbi:unnamed protein product [Brachionus calyciflorus]|uniref:LicD/FKTN/FKRP nucleotidyltransferase domain-containing protein n=1 Tax=Brachionus calyciflorus TaxID=104777 RepID=A0A814C4X9_9BILA|nr:unnamed protein product [Brachionus calyciflorus]
MITKRNKKLLKILLIFKISFLVCVYYTHLKLNDSNLSNYKIENNFYSYLIKEINKIDHYNNFTNKTLNNPKDIFKILYEHKAFLIDVEILNQTKSNNKSSNNNNFNFGIYFKQYYNLLNYLNRSNCNLFNINTNYVNLSIPSAIYLKCLHNNLRIQISAIYDRGDFLWIPRDNFKWPNYRKYFNDKTRSLNHFKIYQVNFSNNYKVYKPQNIQKFLYDYKNSEFIECNYDLAKYNYVSSGYRYRQNLTKNEIVSTKLDYIKQIIESYHKDYWLAGGTLLGWYRDCGMIPHTTDIDLGLLSNQHESRIKQSFKGNLNMPLMLQFGYKNDSYELRLGNNDLWVDLFYFYDYNQTHQWCAYQDKRIKKRRFVSKLNNLLCSAELFNRKYLVPCRVEKYLNEEYGMNEWIRPQDKNYTWTNVFYWKNWTDSEWINAVKFYDLNGNFLNNLTQQYINKYL